MTAQPQTINGTHAVIELSELANLFYLREDRHIVIFI